MNDWYWIILIVIAALAFAMLWLVLRSKPLPVLGPHADSQYIKIGPFNIHYLISGQGPTIVLLHGIGASVYTWRLLIPLLSHRYQVIAVDLPGFGRSSKIAVESYDLDQQTARLQLLLDALNIKECMVVGSSMGGALALWLGLKNPERVKRVVTLAPAIDPRLVPLKLASLAWTSPFFKATAANRYVFSYLLGRIMSKRELINAETIAEYLSPYQDPAAVHAFLKATSSIRDHRLLMELKTLVPPLLVLWGKRDLVVREKNVKKLIQQIPHATYHIHESGGHHLQEDDPVWVAEFIQKFFDSKV